MEKNIGNYLQLGGFISTSEIDNLNNFAGNAKLEIEVNLENHQFEGLDFGFADIKKYSYFKEGEILFNALNTYKILSITKGKQ